MERNLLLQCCKIFALNFHNNYKIVTMCMCKLIPKSSTSSSKMVLDDTVSYCLETKFCLTPYSSATRRVLQNLLVISTLSIMLIWSLKFCLCFPIYSDTGSVLGFSIISPFHLRSHCGQPAVRLINRHLLL
jgi:hypothetical protein